MFVFPRPQYPSAVPVPVPAPVRRPRSRPRPRSVSGRSERQMETWQTIALTIAAITFGVFILWRVRPAFGGQRKPLRTVLKAARARIDAAKDEEERAQALCDAGDACAAAVGRSGEAVQFYLRAMRQQPNTSALLERAIKGLSRKPRALEKLLWRRLGSEPWAGQTREVAKIALKALADLYTHQLHDHIKAQALEHALNAIP